MSLKTAAPVSRAIKLVCGQRVKKLVGHCRHRQFRIRAVLLARGNRVPIIVYGDSAAAGSFSCHRRNQVESKHERIDVDIPDKPAYRATKVTTGAASTAFVAEQPACPGFSRPKPRPSPRASPGISRSPANAAHQEEDDAAAGEWVF
jgi:hypothetical protein